MKNKEFEKMLLNLKPNLEIDKDLKIKNLENDNARLTLQLNKLKKEKQIINPSSAQLKELQKLKSLVGNEKHFRQWADKETRRSCNEQLAKNANRTNRYKALQHMIGLELKFLQKRVKEVLGHQVFMSLINHVDNPRQDGMILTEERKQNFLSLEKTD